MKPPRVGGLVQNAAALIASGAVSAIVGLVFWGVAAHLVPAATIGRSSAELAAMSILGLLSQLSFGTTFERFIPVAGDQTRNFVTRAYSACVLVALVISLTYVLSGLGSAFMPTGVIWRAFFVIAVVMWTVFSLQDAVLVGLRSARWVPVENISYSLAKLALLPLFIMWSSSHGIFLAWNFPVVWLILAVSWYLFARRIPEHQRTSRTREKLPSMRQLVALSGAQYASLLVGVFTGLVTTLIVIDRLGPVANANYYIPAQIAVGVTLLIGSIMRSFFVEAASEPDRMQEFARVTLRTTVVLVIPALAIGIIFAPQILQVFGQNYADNGTTLLRMMLLSMPAVAVTSFYSAFAWLDKHVWWFAIREVASAIIFFAVLLGLLGHLGILAIGVGSLIESGVQGFFFLPILIRRYRLATSTPAPPRRPVPPPSPDQRHETTSTFASTTVPVSRPTPAPPTRVFDVAPTPRVATGDSSPKLTNGAETSFARHRNPEVADFVGGIWRGPKSVNSILVDLTIDDEHINLTMRGPMMMRGGAFAKSFAVDFANVRSIQAIDSVRGGPVGIRIRTNEPDESVVFLSTQRDTVLAVLAAHGLSVVPTPARFELWRIDSRGQEIGN